MWTVLKRGDIAQARQDIESRRVEMLQRQAGEIDRLDADRAELDTLRQLAAVFSDKFKTTAAAAAAPPAASLPVAPAPEIAASVEAAIAVEAVAPLGAAVALLWSGQHGGRPATQPWQVAPRSQPRTNFDAFSHARARGTF